MSLTAGSYLYHWAVSKVNKEVYRVTTDNDGKKSFNLAFALASDGSWRELSDETKIGYIPGSNDEIFDYDQEKGFVFQAQVRAIKEKTKNWTFWQWTIVVIILTIIIRYALGGIFK